MIVKLPIVTKEEYDESTGEAKITRGELPVEIDTSFQAHLKWEEQFSEKMGGIDLQTYSARILPMLKAPLDKVQLFAVIKLLYCYINSDQLPTFKVFSKMFHPAVVKEILDKVAHVLEEVGKSATKNL